MINSNRLSMKPVEKIRVTEVVADRILSLIQEGHLKEGDKLPSQKELSETLKVSRPSLREAISGLVMLGIIEAKAGQGFYVRKAQMDRGLDLSGVLANIQDEKISYLYEMREIIETAAAGLAAQRATEEDIRILYAFIEGIKVDIPTIGPGAIEKGLLFHQLVTDAAHNPVLSQFESTLLSQFSVHVPLLYTDPPSIERDVESHTKIVRSIEAHDEAGAIQAARDHIMAFAKEMLNQDS
jgi:GntR family transcriptional regulator, transcriptional repressor for pyruvate dehydrogenase complex